MIFLTYWFFIFAALFFPLYWAVRRPLARKLTLLVGCVIFHTHFAGPAGVLPIIILGIITYMTGLSQNRHLCLYGIILCALSLVFYKYTSFVFANLVSVLLPKASHNVPVPVQLLLPTSPPLAISFFTFEFVHYLYDIRKGESPLRNPLQFTLFAIFWPSIVSGPVKRYQQFVPALEKGSKQVSQEDVAQGMLRMGMGLIKKFAADNLTIYIDYAHPQFAQMTFRGHWVFVGAISLRILLDFSGYSDMAIGYARMIGITLPENFNWPYLAKNLTEFWHRWHISLSTWIRDYIYIPLGGNRYGAGRKVINGIVAFAICGLWHGAGWNFVVWGLYHGAGIAISSYYQVVVASRRQKILPALFDNALMSWAWPMCSWAVTLAFVTIGWVFFFYPLPEAYRMIVLLFGGG